MTDAPAVAAVVPVRGLPAGKTRLAALLDADQRNRLVRAMLEDVVRTLQQAPGVASVTILSRDAAATREAERLGVGFLRQPAAVHGLNAAIVHAQQDLAGSGALLIVPADLPLVTPDDVGQLVAQAQTHAVVLAEADDGGTNGLLLRPPAAIAPAFGQGSAGRHRAAAQAAGVPVHTVRSQRWALDLDTPEDLSRLLALVPTHPHADTLRTLECLRAPDFPAIAPLDVAGGGCA